MADAPRPKENPLGKRILVVEDDDPVREMIRATLEAEDFTIQTARDGRHILERASSFNPHLILTDLMMPGGGGYEVLRALQTDDATRQVPVIIMTGYNFDQSTLQMMKQEPNVKAFFEKPIRPAALTAKVHEILNTKSKDEQFVEKQRSGRDQSLNKMDDMM